MVANRVSTCATQNLHIWPPLFSSGFSFRAHVIEKPPASAKEAHSCKFFLKQPTSQLLAVRAKTLIHSLFPSLLPRPLPPLLTKPPPKKKKEKEENLPLDEGEKVSGTHLLLVLSSSPSSLAAFL